MVLTNGTHHPFLPNDGRFRISGFADGLHPKRSIGIVLQGSVKSFSGHEPTKINKRSRIRSILFVSSSNAPGSEQVILAHDAKIVVEQTGVSAGARSGLQQGNSQDHGSRNPIRLAEGIGNRTVFQNESMAGILAN